MSQRRSKAPDEGEVEVVRKALERLTGDGNGTMKMVLQVLAERNRQEAEIAGVERDNGKEAAEWVALINQYAGRAMAAMEGKDKPGHSCRDRLVQTAALCLAAIEASDRRAF